MYLVFLHFGAEKGYVGLNGCAVAVIPLLQSTVHTRSSFSYP